ncbi:hypothetical protein KIM372_07750 [Bombiscardovia nodaiensis]|uniref:Septum formation initiator family protein n=1 Tax=Bombiscardovia nodaiensis TaxID=2932181 RepID=A0ABM8B811_9BIFI|nr:hypothetical protein KIM372_07750 [Bombiscardovia nodaiensis]
MEAVVGQASLALSQSALRACLDRAMENRASQQQIAVVESQLGRYPRGIVAVGAQCVCGNPLAVITRPELPGGIPFPTTCYLTSPQAVKAVSHLEAEGVMATMNEQLAQDENLRERYERAHRTYLAFRQLLAERLGDDQSHIEGISAGGMPKRVKCLHALVAQSLVMGPGVNPLGDQALEAVADSFSPSRCDCDQPWPQRALAGESSL